MTTKRKSKPKRRKPREFWIVFGSGEHETVHRTEQSAKDRRWYIGKGRVIRVREVPR